jgi:SAM-dependent methyltransferase
MSTSQAATGSAAIQRQLWGVRAQDWADAMEGQMRALYVAVLERIGVGQGTEVLDAGCGSGLAAQLAARRGALVTGFDATPELLEIARGRVPNGDFREGDLESLPFADAAFDAVVGFNSFQYAATPQTALSEARRVARAGAPVAIATWAVPERCPAAVYLAALKPLMPPAPPGAPGPFALSAPGALEDLARAAGLMPGDAEEVECIWIYPDDASALRGLMASGPAVKAIQTSGEEAVQKAVLGAIAPFADGSGGYSIGSAFRYLITTA